LFCDDFCSLCISVCYYPYPLYSWSAALILTEDYSIAEMAGGWRNKIMQDEVGFILFESA
jgi:hypothetical protein